MNSPRWSGEIYSRPEEIDEAERQRRSSVSRLTFAERLWRVGYLLGLVSTLSVLGAVALKLNAIHRFYPQLAPAVEDHARKIYGEPLPSLKHCQVPATEAPIMALIGPSGTLNYLWE